MKKRLFLIITLCIVLDWYIKNNVIHHKQDTHGPSVETTIPYLK